MLATGRTLDGWIAVESVYGTVIDSPWIEREDVCRWMQEDPPRPTPPSLLAAAELQHRIVFLSTPSTAFALQKSSRHVDGRRKDKSRNAYLNTLALSQRFVSDGESGFSFSVQ